MSAVRSAQSLIRQAVKPQDYRDQKNHRDGCILSSILSSVMHLFLLRCAPVAIGCHQPVSRVKIM
jgi:hypothetical protein